MKPTLEDTQLAIKILGYGADGPATERAARLIAEYRHTIAENIAADWRMSE